MNLDSSDRPRHRIGGAVTGTGGEVEFTAGSVDMHRPEGTVGSDDAYVMSSSQPPSANDMRPRLRLGTGKNSMTYDS